MSRAEESDAPEKTKTPGAMIGTVSIITGVLWLIGVPVAAFALLGQDGMISLSAIEIGALVAAALLPAIMVWFSGAAAREGARARAEATRLADAADRLLNPERSAEQSTRDLATSVRAEIATLDNALEQTLRRLDDVQRAISAQSQVVDEMRERAKSGAGQMILGMDRERADLMKISTDLTAQATNIGDAISRHTRVIAEAARLAEAELHAADTALNQHVSSFGAAASLIGDRTHSLSQAAQGSADSALRLENALSNALDVLAKATSLTDAARQSAEQATLAANSTAGAVRETTARAIDDAKRVADMIRGEAVNVEREAEVALEKLREAAEAARTAAVNARTAAESVRVAPSQPAAPQRQRSEPSTPDYYAEQRRAPEQERYTPPPQQERYAREEPPQEPEPRPRREATRYDDFGAPPVAPSRPSAPAAGGWTWRELLSQVDEPAAPQAPAPQQAPPARRRTEEPASARYAPPAADPRGGHAGLPAADMIERAGLRVHEVFSASGLERVAQRARSGTQARRRAVLDAAPDAVRRLSEHLARDPQANHEAMEFLRIEGARIAELLARGRAAMGAEATRAFLIIDAAAG